MREYSKFRIITVGFILMFIFVVAAMYSNTKDITAQKVREAELSRNSSNTNNYANKNSSYSKKQKELKFEENVNTTSNDNMEELTNRIEQLERIVRLLNNEINPSTRSPLNCQIRGILDNGDVIPLSPNESLEEANMNNKEMVITCTVK